MDNRDDSHNSDIFDSNEDEEHSCEEEEEESEEKECDSEEESEDYQTSEDEEDYDPWQALINEAKLPLSDEFQENVERLEKEGSSTNKAKRESFSAVLPKLRKELQDVYLDRLHWMSEMKKDPVHKKIMKTRKRYLEDDSFDPDEAMVAAVKKRKYQLQHMLEDKQHFYDDDDDDTDVYCPLKNDVYYH